LVPDASPPPPNEAIVTSGAGAVRLWQVAPWRTWSEDPKDPVEHAPVVHTRNAAQLVRQERLDCRPFIIGEFVAHDLRLRFGRLNHVQTDAFNRQTRTSRTSEINREPDTPSTCQNRRE